MPDPVQQLERSRFRVGAPRPLMGDGRLGDVFQHGQVREQVEVLEDETDARPLVQNQPLRQLFEPVALESHADRLAVDADVSEVQSLQVIDRPEQCRLPGSGRTENDRDRAPGDGQVDAVQDLVAIRMPCVR